MIQLQDRIRGSLMGGAIGDAFGYPVEFISSYEKIKAKYGDNGITEYDLSIPLSDKAYDKAQFSDDTQMTLYTAEGLLEAENNDSPLLATIRDAYLAWYGGQTGKKVKISYKSELAQIDELNQDRAPGSTCLTSLFAIHSGNSPVNDSKGCGGVMRVAPIGLYGAAHDWPLEKTAKTAGEIAELTHLHPLSTYSSAALAVLCQLCATSDNLTETTFKKIIEHTFKALDRVYQNDAPYLEEFKGIILNAGSFVDSPRPDWEVIENELGGGWVAEETLAISIFSVLRHFNDFKACMICAVNHGGDSDSTGAVAGNIIGAIHGSEAIPAYFKDNIQLRELLINTSDSLC